jgi:hypothetical protein
LPAGTPVLAHRREIIEADIAARINALDNPPREISGAQLLFVPVTRAKAALLGAARAAILMLLATPKTTTQRRRAVMTAPASAASTTSITQGSSATCMECAQLAERLNVSRAKTAYVTTPAPSQAARAAGLDSQTLCSGIPAFSGTRAPAGSVRAAYPAAATMPSRKTPPITNAATTAPPLSLKPPCLAR